MADAVVARTLMERWKCKIIPVRPSPMQSKTLLYAVFDVVFKQSILPHILPHTLYLCLHLCLHLVAQSPQILHPLRLRVRLSLPQKTLPLELVVADQYGDQ